MSATNNGGRPPINIDKKIFENLCGIGCTREEIADAFDVDSDTVQAWCKREYKKSFSVVFRQKRGKGQISLRRDQMQLAKTNPAMAIWLGKQMLKQRDNPIQYEDGENEQGYSGLPARVIGRAYVDINRSIDSGEYTYYDFKGGRGSLKSSFCGLKLIDLVMLNESLCAMAVRQVKDTLKDSVYNQIVWSIDELGLTEQFHCTKNPMEIKRKSTGQVIYFRGADDPMKIKSIRPPRGMHIGVVWIEEADQLHGEEALRSILQSAMRGGENTLVFRSYNTPISQAHYINQESLRRNFANGEIIDRRYIHHSYYYEAPREWLGKDFFNMAEYVKETSEKAYRHEYLGEAVGTGGTVFENVDVRVITEDELKGFEQFYYGVDWGFYPDPFAFVKCAYKQIREANLYKRILYILDEYVGYKQNNRGTADILQKEKHLTRDDVVICDSAEPKSIADYIDYGLYARGAEKGAGSLNYSMKWLQGLTRIVIDKNKCPNTAKEFLEYEYERTRDGEIISGYPDKNNHCIDATRYSTNLLWREMGR